MQTDKKTIVFIPPNGQTMLQDFSLQRIITFLLTTNQYNIIILSIPNKLQNDPINSLCTNINIENTDKLFDKLRQLNYDYIFHRAWMHRYEFAAKLVQSFDNVIVNIKDWNFAPQEIYKIIFDDDSDFKAIEIIFTKAHLILSHYTEEQINLWKKNYSITKNKFIFFPEKCNNTSFYRKNILYKNIKLVFAGTAIPTSYPEEYFPGKYNLKSIKKLTSQNISIDYVIPESFYERMFNERKILYHDLIFESQTNNNFNLIKGKILNPSILKSYHFGVMELEASCKNKYLAKYAVMSKFAFYLESHLPILINEKFTAIAEIVEKHGIGIVFKNEDLNDFSKTLEISQKEYNNFLDNILIFRKTFTYTKKEFNKIFT